jgi:hypothetical protein
VTSAEEFLSNYSPKVRELAYKTRALIQKIIPNAQEFVDPPSKIIAYGCSPKYANLICAIAPYKTYVNLIFTKGTKLSDPDKLLTGCGKRARHVKITSDEIISNPALQSLVKQALALRD